MPNASFVDSVKELSSKTYFLQEVNILQLDHNGVKNN